MPCFLNCASISCRAQKVLPSGRGLPFTSSTFFLPTGLSSFNIAETGELRAAVPTAANAAFLRKVLLTIILNSDRYCCPDLYKYRQIFGN